MVIDMRIAPLGILALALLAAACGGRTTQSTATTAPAPAPAPSGMATTPSGMAATTTPSTQYYKWDPIDRFAAAVEQQRGTSR
jgi:ABC-type glycerol-3-phosphate transport system substrate-binding protein